MSSADWYVLHQGVEEGPFPEEVVIRLAQNTIITTSTPVRAGEGEWRPAGNFPQFFLPETGTTEAASPNAAPTISELGIPPERAGLADDFAQMSVDFILQRGAASLGLYGRGQIAIHQGTLFVKGKKHRTLLRGTPAECLFPAGAAMVEAPQSRTVKLLVNADPTASEWQLLTVKFRDLATAQAFADCLPSYESSVTLEERQFARDLARSTPHIVVTIALIAINLLVFALTVRDGASLSRAPANIPIHLAWGANLGPLTKDGEWWRLVTAMFLHSGLSHLLFNMAALWYGGQLTERIYGNALFLLIYVGAGIAGSLASLMWLGEDGVSVGASGAIFGVYGALLAFLLRRRDEVPSAPLVRIGATAALLTTYSLLSGFGQSGVDNAGHLGGLGAGFAIGLACARSLDLSNRWRSWLHWPLGGAVTAAILGTMFWLLPPPKFLWREQLAAEQAIRKFNAAEMAMAAKSKELEKRLSNMNHLQAAQLIRSEMLKPWVEAESELAIVHVNAAAPAAEALVLLRRYAQQRRTLFQTLAALAEAQQDARKPEVQRLIAEIKATEAAIAALNERRAPRKK